jgi:hypothetical protein
MPLQSWIPGQVNRFPEEHGGLSKHIRLLSAPAAPQPRENLLVRRQA